MKTIFSAILSFSLICSNLVYAHGNHHKSAEKKHSPSYFQTAANVFGAFTNTLGLLSGGYNIYSFDRHHPTPGKVINLGLNIFDLALHGANLAGYGIEITDLLDDGKTRTEHVANGWRSTKFFGANLFALTHHLTNFFYIERNGFAKLFHIYDVWEVAGHANDIRVNSGEIADAIVGALTEPKKEPEEEL